MNIVTRNTANPDKKSSSAFIELIQDAVMSTEDSAYQGNWSGAGSTSTLVKEAVTPSEVGLVCTKRAIWPVA